MGDHRKNGFNWVARRALKQIGAGAGLCESGDTDDDQVDRHDVVQQTRHQQDKDAGDEGNKRRDLGNGNGLRGLLRRQSMIPPFMHTPRQITRKLRNLLRRPDSRARGFVYEGEVWLSFGHLAYATIQSPTMLMIGTKLNSIHHLLNPIRRSNAANARFRGGLW